LIEKRCLNAEFPGVIVCYHKSGCGMTHMVVMPPSKDFQNLGVLLSNYIMMSAWLAKNQKDSLRIFWDTPPNLAAFRQKKGVARPHFVATST